VDRVQIQNEVTVWLVDILGGHMDTGLKSSELVKIRIHLIMLFGTAVVAFFSYGKLYIGSSWSRLRVSYFCTVCIIARCTITLFSEHLMELLLDLTRILDSLSIILTLFFFFFIKRCTPKLFHHKTLLPAGMTV
jgi:hypothetical protein